MIQRIVRGAVLFFAVGTGIILLARGTAPGLDGSSKIPAVAEELVLVRAARPPNLKMQPSQSCCGKRSEPQESSPGVARREEIERRITTLQQRNAPGTWLANIVGEPSRFIITTSDGAISGICHVKAASASSERPDADWTLAKAVLRSASRPPTKIQLGDCHAGFVAVSIDEEGVTWKREGGHEDFLFFSLLNRDIVSVEHVEGAEVYRRTIIWLQ